MKRIIFILIILTSAVCSYAQYNEYNSLSRKALVFYKKDANGFYRRMTDVLLSEVPIEKVYAFNKKENTLYVLSYNANAAIILDKYNSKIIKKNNSIQQLKGKDLIAAIDMCNCLLDQKFQKLNEQREEFIKDSIAKAKADSIERVLEYKRKQEAKRQAAENYRNTHRYQIVPTGDASLSCSLCDESFSEDSIWCLGIKNDSIYFATTVKGDLGLSYIEAHAAEMPYSLTSNNDFIYHYKIFSDSLTNDSTDYQDFCKYINYINHLKYLNELRKIAPYGYVNSWSWDDEYSTVTLNLNYENTNPKTIRYISVYFKITNDVGDVRCTGVFRGTGPLKQWESASWNWDNSMYFVAGDASKMRITKIVITWMNGKQQVVSGRYLQFNDNDDDDDEDEDEDE